MTDKPVPHPAAAATAGTAAAPVAPSPVQRKGSLLRTIRAVAWSFIGLRKGSEYAQDVEKLNPVHIIVVGLVAVFLLVISLITLVNVIV